MCGWPVGGNPCPGGEQWTPSGPTTGVTTLKHVHPALLSCPALRPPEPLAVTNGMARANPAAAMSGMIIPRISPPSVDDTTRSIWSRPVEFHIRSLVEREVQERDSDRAGEEHDEDAEQQPAEAEVRECALVVVQLEQRVEGQRGEQQREVQQRIVEQQHRAPRRRVAAEPLGEPHEDGAERQRGRRVAE